MNPQPMPIARVRGFAGLFGRQCCIAPGLLAAVLTGCGGSAPTAPAPTAAVRTEPKSEVPPTEKSPAAGTDEATPASVKADVSGRKWIGDIPYDVFFDDPLAVVANTATVNVPGASPVASAGPTAPLAEKLTSSVPAAPSASTDNDWKSLMAMEQISTEAKRLRNHLTSSLQSVGTYNGNYEELQVDGAVVAALAEVVRQHPEEVSWKANAKFLRDYGKRLSEAAKALGRENYTASQQTAEGIEAIFSGNLPADAKDAAESAPFGEVASRSGVMKRISKASEWMRANVNSESVFNKELDQIRQESAIIAVLGKVVSDHSYDSADEADYAQFAKDLVDGAKDSAAAADEKSYPKFQEAMNKVNKACAQCHASYGNG